MNPPQRTFFNLAVVSGASLLQIVNQFLFFGVLAALYGASEDTDALAAALVLPTVLAAIVTGSIAYVLIPELVSKFDKADDESMAWGLASYVGAVTTAISLLGSLLLIFAAGPICHWLYDDLSDSGQVLTVRLLKILGMQVVLTGWISWAQAVHHSRHQFLIPALGGVLGTGASLGIAAWSGKSDIAAIAWAINAGSLVSVLVHLIPLVSKLKMPQAESDSLLRLVGMVWPLLLGAAFIRLDPLVDRVLASELDSGSVAHVNYAQRIMMALLAIGTSSLSLIAFPQLAQRLSEDGNKGFSEHFSLALRRMVLIVVPVVLGVSCFSVWIIGDLLQRGEFSDTDSVVVGYLVVALMGMFAGASAGELLARGFYVLGDTKTPTAVGALSLVVGLVLKLVLFKFIGIWGIALGVSSYYLLSATGMSVLLSRRVGSRIFVGCSRYGLQAIVSSLFACGCCYWVYAIKLGGTWVAAPVGAVTYFGGLVILRNSDAIQLFTVVSNRLTRGKFLWQKNR